MKITDPKSFLNAIDKKRLKEILGIGTVDAPKTSPIYVEPGQRPSQVSATSKTDQQPQPVSSREETLVPALEKMASPTQSENKSDIQKGKVQVLGDFIDTDAVSAIYTVGHKKKKGKMLITNSLLPLRFLLVAPRTKNLACTASNTHIPISEV
jgi:hypothetical protein